MKPDTIDDPIPAQKPDTIDENIYIYDKPNEYEEEKEQYSLPQEVLDDLVIRAEFVDGKRPDVRTSDELEELQPKRPSVTSSLLSHIPPPSTSLAATGFSTLSPSASSISSAASGHSSSTTTSTRLALLEILKKKPMEDLIEYDLRKASLTRPEEHHVYFHGTKVKAYKKIQPHSYSWGFQNTLYRVFADDEDLKVAETRRRAFKKEIMVEWGDFSLKEEDAVTNSNILQHITKSHLMFTYETEFEGYRVRWKRISLLSHDMICEIKHLKEKWRVIAEFDSHRMGYFVQLGKLIIDKDSLNLVEKPNHFEAHIIIICCTLIDLMREVVEQAIGINKGGIVGSD
ncbi:hypothetical protein G6F37_005384 [Rhizopus arrhizus]|nr:hypothetical protein G6F38_000374 [Rhizopus arrhizus]KAG1158897.1 hypothetical protein G6F37_005384 [Rhizopus arrhizus]